MKTVLISIFLVSTYLFLTEQATTTSTTLQPHSCGLNQEYRCSNKCEPHCPELPWRPCDPVIDCLDRACHCAKGFVEDRQRNNICVKPSECTPPVTPITEAPVEENPTSTIPTCGPNQEYRCSHGCEASCPEFPRHPCDQVLTCFMGCYCVKNFVLDRQRDGACVKYEQCSPVKNDSINH